MPAPVFKHATPAPGTRIPPHFAHMANNPPEAATTRRFPGRTPNVSNVPKAATPAPEEKPGTVSEEFADLLKELESARLKKNAYTREFSAAEKALKASFPDFNLDEYTLQLLAEDAPDEDGNTPEVAVSVTITKTDDYAETETLDKAKLKKLVTPDIYELCTVVQKGLIEEHAGGAVLKKVLTVSRVKLDEPLVTIKSEKVKTASAKKKAKAKK